VNSNRQQVRDLIADEAAQWHVLNRAGPLDREARAEFFAWLKRSPLHVEEYLAIALLTRDLAAAAEAPEFDMDALLERSRAEPDNIVALEPVRSLRPATAAPWRARRIWRHAAAAAVAMILVAVAAVFAARDGERFGLPRTYRTAQGELRVQPLPDGSLLHLNTDSEVTVRFSRAERLIELDRGQALFEVAHDPGRRFRVAAGQTGVLALGTQFDMYRKPAAVAVTVVDGTVAVFAGAPATAGAALPANAVWLDAGYQVEVTDVIGAARRVDARQAVAWLHRQIAFDSRPLGDVAAEFNRYGTVQLEIDDPRLRALPISGVFDAYDADSFTAFLATLDGVVVERTPTRIRVVASATPSR
jgi:transmembrane sensor